MNEDKICDDFGCPFAGTELCIAEDCPECKLHNCRGCIHLWECVEELNQTVEDDYDDETDFI